MQQKSTEKTRFITLVGMLSALATVLYYIGEVPMPFAANLKIGFSDLPALIGAIVAGPCGWGCSRGRKKHPASVPDRFLWNWRDSKLCRRNWHGSAILSAVSEAEGKA